MLETCKISGFADEIDANLDTQIQTLNQLNIHYMEIRGVNGRNILDHTAEEVVEIKRRLDQGGIRVSSVGSPIGKIKITDPFEPHFEKFRHCVEIAKILETPYIRMFSFFIPEGQNPETFRDEVMKRLSRFVSYAKDQNVVLLHENEKEIYGDTAPRCLELFQEFYCDHFQGVFDFANFVQCGQDTLAAYEMLKPYIAYIHIKDAKAGTGEVVPSGMGDGNVKTILTQLHQSGYQGFLSLEPHLADFTGFSALEQGHSSRLEEWDGKKAFTVACQALRKILETCA